MPEPAERICHYCGKPADTKDHIWPKSKGGPNARWNIVDACKACNGAKGNRLPDCECMKCQNAVIKMVNGWTKIKPPKKRVRRKKFKHYHICTYLCDQE